MRLDDDKLAALRRWGRGLREADSKEYAAAGRAILMLIEEVERLRLELLRTHEQLPSGETAADAGEPVASTLHGRVQQVLGQDSDSPVVTEPVEAGSGLESERTRLSPESWIEALRRQK